MPDDDAALLNEIPMRYRPFVSANHQWWPPNQRSRRR
jgi:hypothetical protein